MALALSWSPDSRSLALWAGKALVRVSIPDGAIQTLSPLDERPNGTSWSPDGSLISFASNTGVYEVLSRGGTPRLVYKPEDRMMLPRYLPLEGTARALLITSFPETADVTTVALLDMETGGKQDLIAGANAAYDRSGHILYQDTLRSSEATVWGVPFSLESLEIQEEPFLITDGHSPSVSNQGSLVYRDSDGEVRSRIAIRGRDGELIRSVGDAEDSLLHIRLSPNGKSIAIRSRAAGNSDIWVYDVDRGSPLRLTFHPGNDSGPIWSPDGAQIAYGSFRGSWRDIYRVRPNEAGGESPLYESPANKRPTDWSRDGRYILFRSNDELRYLARSDDGGYEDLPLMSASGRLSVRFSPD